MKSVLEPPWGKAFLGNRLLEQREQTLGKVFSLPSDLINSCLSLLLQSSPALRADLRRRQCPSPNPRAHSLRVSSPVLFIGVLILPFSNIFCGVTNSITLGNILVVITYLEVIKILDTQGARGRQAHFLESQLWCGYIQALGRILLPNKWYLQSSREVQ